MPPIEPPVRPPELASDGATAVEVGPIDDVAVAVSELDELDVVEDVFKLAQTQREDTAVAVLGKAV
jgi:hypothetical protein